MKQLLSSILLIIILTIFGNKLVWAASQGISATVKNSICGNGIKESGEECDNSDLNGKSCENLGFSGGKLSCNSACGFETSSCELPVVNGSDVSENEVDSLFAAGYLLVPSNQQITSTTKVSTTSNIVINAGSSSIALPKNLNIGREDGQEFDPTRDLTAGSVAASSVTASLGGSTVGALQWGMEGHALDFDSLITIDLSVGKTYSGLTLNVFRSESLGDGWTTDGLINSTCLVDSNGICEVKTVKASYFAAVLPAASSGTPEPAISSSSRNQLATTSQPSESNSPLNTQTQIPQVPVLPPALRIFDIDGNGRILLKNLPTVATLWFNSFRNNATNCDINKDGSCNIKDFSILMFYVGR